MEEQKKSETTPETTPQVSSNKQWLDMPRAVIIGAIILAIGIALGLDGRSIPSIGNGAPIESGVQQTEESVMADLVTKAKRLGINKNDFTACMESDKHLTKISTDEALVMTQGTPYNIITSKKANVALPGALPYENFIELINQLTSDEPIDIPDEFISTFDENELTIRPTDHVRGSVDAPIKIFEYSDIDCPYCKSLHPILVRLVEEKPETVAWIYRHHPLDNLHPFARMKAEATECVAELSNNPAAFWNFIDELVK